MVLLPSKQFCYNCTILFSLVFILQLDENWKGESIEVDFPLVQCDHCKEYQKPMRKFLEFVVDNKKKHFCSNECLAASKSPMFSATVSIPRTQGTGNYIRDSCLTHSSCYTHDARYRSKFCNYSQFTFDMATVNFF